MLCNNSKCKWNKESLCTHKFIVVILNNVDGNFICCSSDKDDFKDLTDTIAYGLKGIVKNETIL